MKKTFILIAMVFWFVTAAQAGEVEIVQKWCPGEVEVPLEEPFGPSTRVDCIHNGVAWEADWGHKWAEAIGQALYYAERTELRPGVLLILKDANDVRYLARLLTALKQMRSLDPDKKMKVRFIEEKDWL